MPEALRFIEADGRRQRVVGFQIEAGCAGSASLTNHGFEEAAADAGALARFGHRHLGHFKLAGSHGEQGAAAHGFAVADGQEDSAAAVQDEATGIVDHRRVFRLQGVEVAHDPFPVQPLEVRLVPRGEFADQERCVLGS
jgi:hypothetical protein